MPQRRLTRRGFAGAAAAVSTAGFAAPAKAAQFEFRCGTSAPPEHPGVVRSRQMWAAVERESGGRLRVQTFANSQLGTDDAMIGQLRLGAIQFFLGVPQLAAVVPAIGIAGLGYAFKDDADALRAMDGPVGGYLRTEFAAKGLTLLPAPYDSGMRAITASSHPIRTPDDFNGFKIRVPQAPIFVDLFRTLGASPVSLNNNEIYVALQTKIVDGQENSLATIQGTRVYEVQKFLSLTNHSWNGLALVANAGVWNALPADLQQTVERNQRAFGRLERRDTLLFNAAVVGKLQRLGLAVNAVDPAVMRARLGPYYAKWRGEFGSTLWGLLEQSVGKLP